MVVISLPLMKSHAPSLPGNMQIHALTNSKTPAERLIGTLALAARINAAHAYRVMWKKTTNANVCTRVIRFFFYYYEIFSYVVPIIIICFYVPANPCNEAAKNACKKEHRQSCDGGMTFR